MCNHRKHFASTVPRHGRACQDGKATAALELRGIFAQLRAFLKLIRIIMVSKDAQLCRQSFSKV